MEEALEKAIKSSASKAETSSKPDEAMKFTQAALNAANALAVLRNIPK